MNNLLLRRLKMQHEEISVNISVLEKTKDYFTHTTQDAIIKYNSSDDFHHRSKIYDKYIKNAFEKLVENLIYNGKYYRFEESITELKSDAIVYLIEQMHLYKEEKGKAFSYFNVICNNYFKNRAKLKYQQKLQETDIESADCNRNVQCEEHYDEVTETITSFLNVFSSHMDDNLEWYFKKKEQHIACAVITLLQRRHQIENFNKKALYVMIREMTNMTTITITKVVNLMKLYYQVMYKEFDATDKITLLTQLEIKKLRKLN